MQGAPLAGREVVITRPAEQSAELAGLLERRGAAVRARPLIRIGPPADPQPLAAALSSLAAFDCIVFTSANAVRACIAAAPRGAGWPPCVCVGPGTAAVAEAAGLRVTLVPEQFTAEGLAAAWPSAALPGARILWPRASGAREVLGEALSAGGASVHACEAYRTLEDAAAARALHVELRTAPADALLFTSPSAVRTFAATGAAPAATLIAVIGTITAAAAERAGLQVHVVPARHTLEAMVEALEEHFARDADRPQGTAADES